MDLLGGVARIRGIVRAYYMVAVTSLPWFCSPVLVIPGHKAHGYLVRWLPPFLAGRAGWPLETCVKLGPICAPAMDPVTGSDQRLLFFCRHCVSQFSAGEKQLIKSQWLCWSFVSVCMGSIISWTATNLSVPVWCKAESFETCGGWEPWIKPKLEVKDHKNPKQNHPPLQIQKPTKVRGREALDISLPPKTLFLRERSPMDYSSTPTPLHFQVTGWRSR